MYFQRLWSLHIKILYLDNLNEMLREMVRSLFFLRTILYSLFLFGYFISLLVNESDFDLFDWRRRITCSEKHDY